MRVEIKLGPRSKYWPNHKDSENIFHFFFYQVLYPPRVGTEMNSQTDLSIDGDPRIYFMIEKIRLNCVRNRKTTLNKKSEKLSENRTKLII